jgi:hypothetical protein
VSVEITTTRRGPERDYPRVNARLLALRPPSPGSASSFCARLGSGNCGSNGATGLATDLPRGRDEQLRHVTAERGSQKTQRFEAYVGVTSLNALHLSALQAHEFGQLLLRECALRSQLDDS